jgi:hypothetical protein
MKYSRLQNPIESAFSHSTETATVMQIVSMSGTLTSFLDGFECCLSFAMLIKSLSGSARRTLFLQATTNSFHSMI